MIGWPESICSILTNKRLHKRTHVHTYSRHDKKKIQFHHFLAINVSTEMKDSVILNFISFMKQVNGV